MNTIVVLNLDSGKVRELPPPTPTYPLPSSDAMREASWFGEARITPSALESGAAARGTLADAKLGDRVLIAEGIRPKGFSAEDWSVWIVDGTGIRNEMFERRPAAMVPLWESLVVCVSGLPKSRELRRMALEQAESEELVAVERRPHYLDPNSVVETLTATTADGRPRFGGQAIKGRVVCGEWELASQTLISEQEDDEGRYVRIHLDGRTVPMSSVELVALKNRRNEEEGRRVQERNESMKARGVKPQELRNPKARAAYEAYLAADRLRLTK